MTPRLQGILDRAERLYRDVGLETVRDWKRRTGGPAVGFLPIWAPRELLHAQGVLPVGLMGGGEDVEIIRGDAFYQSYICHLPRSIVELGLGGQLDVLDGVSGSVASSTSSTACSSPPSATSCATFPASGR